MFPAKSFGAEVLNSDRLMLISCPSHWQKPKQRINDRNHHTLGDGQLLYMSRADGKMFESVTTKNNSKKGYMWTLLNCS